VSGPATIELMIETWRVPGVKPHYLWSVWEDGKRSALSRPHASLDIAETDGIDYVRRNFGRDPDKVTPI
jgi:hypothetical protein